MRAAPVGDLYQHDPDKLKEVAHATGICTHRHPAGDAACIGAAYLVKLALDGISPHKMIDRLSTFTAGVSVEFDHAISKVEKCLGWEDEEKALAHLGEGWVGEEAVDKIKELRKYTEDHDEPSPESRRQYEMVLLWVEEGE